MIIANVIERNTKRILNPRPPLRLSEYAQQFRIIPPGTSHYTGPWRNELTPHLIEPMDCITDPEISTVVLMGPAQAAKTEMITNAISYFIEYEPAPIILIMPIDVLVESYSKERLTPTIRAMPGLSALIDTRSRRDSFNKIDEKIFPGGSLFMGSGATATTYVQRPRRIGIIDDLDQLAHEIKGQGDPITLLEKRTETYPNRVLIYCGTPTDENSHTLRMWRSGDRRESRVPCPECGEYQTIVHEKFVYEQDRGDVFPDSVFYPCEKCGSMIPQSKADWMRARIKWKPARKTSGIASFWVKGGAYEVGWKSWHLILSEYLRSKESHESRKTFWNVTLARIFRVVRDVPNWEILMARKKIFKRGDIPKDCLCLTLSCDVQHDRIEVLLMGWGRRRQRYVIQHYIFGGDPAKEATWNNLKTLINQAWPAPLLCTAIDCGDGNTAPHVYRFVREQHSDRVIAVKGSSKYMETYIDTARHIDLRLSGKRSQSGVKVWLVGTGFIKAELYSFYRLQKTGDDYPPGWIHFADGFDDEFYQQATSESLTPKKTAGGVMRWVWVKIRERNEILDLLVYGTAAAASRGWHTWTDAHWNVLERAKNSGPVSPDDLLRRKKHKGRQNHYSGISLD